jgi:hypothetical protein
MKGKDEDTDILMIQLEFENDQSNKGMKNEPQTPFFFCCFILRPMFGFLKEFGDALATKVNDD